MQTNPPCRTVLSQSPPTGFPVHPGLGGGSGQCRGCFLLPPRPAALSTRRPTSYERSVRETGVPSHCWIWIPQLPQLLPVDSKVVPANQADYPLICSNLKIKTDKEKIFREQCQAEDITLLSDLYLSNGFMAFNNLKRNIMFFNTLF